MKTAEEFLNNKFPEFEDLDKENIWVNIESAMIEFAKLHVEAALKAASEEVILDYGDYISDGHYERFVDKDSILNSYSLDKIK